MKSSMKKTKKSAKTIRSSDDDRTICCGAYSAGIVKATGWLCLLLLLLSASIAVTYNIEELLNIPMAILWSLALCNIQALLLGVYLEHPGLLIPFRIACAVLLITSTAAVIILLIPAIIAICFYTVVLCVLVTEPRRIPAYEVGILEANDYLLMFAAWLVAFLVVAVIDIAVVECVEKMEADNKEKAATAPSPV